MRRVSSLTAAGLFVATAFAAAQAPAQPPVQPQDGSAQAPEVTFRVEVNYVEEDVRVVDRNGNFVRGLKREDFLLTEDNKPQKVNTFGMVDIPLTPVRRPLFMGPDAMPIEPDVASNERVMDGRLYLLLLDDYHTAALRSQNVKNLARRFVLEKLGPNDQAAVVPTSGLLSGSQDFTQNRRLLVEAINNFIGQKLPSAAVTKTEARARDEASSRALSDAEEPEQITPENRYTEDMDAPERTYKARAALNSLRNIAEWMSAIQGRRKAIIYISEGVDYNMYDMFVGSRPEIFNFENFNMIQQETWDTIHAASRSNVQIYPVDPRGLTSMAQENIEMGGLPLLALHLGPESLNQELQTSQMNLRQLAEETGGVAAVGTNDMNRAFDRIVQENSSYYVLGYYSSNEKRDGKMRNISVKVNGYPDAQVTYRKRYAAARGKAPRNTAAGKPVDPAAGLTAELMSAMAAPLPMTGMQLRLQAVPQKGTGKNARLRVIVQTSGKDLVFKENNGVFSTKLSFSIGVFNKQGKPVFTERPDADLNLRPESHDRVRQNGVRVVRQMSVPPGRYQLRVAAQDSSKAKQGTAILDIDVPDFTKPDIAISGVALTSSADRSVPTGSSADVMTFEGGLPAPPSTLRDFPSNTELAAFVEVYDNKPTPAHRIDVTATVKADDGRVVFTNSQDYSTEELHGAAGGFGYSVRMPMTGWTPGLYVLTIDAKSRIGNQAPISKVIQFQVN
ncbi:MAG: VWA domain-containing protein [Vicinamibacterales bacterium]|nr:VWA domain-containing protein [Vicinamibacterales bacterium]